jgi:nucleotide-binding universal stress UspA family protein
MSSSWLIDSAARLTGGRGGGGSPPRVLRFYHTPSGPRPRAAPAPHAAPPGANLVVDPGQSQRGLPRTRLHHVRDCARRTGAKMLVTRTAPAVVASLLTPDRSPALAAATGLDTVLVSERAARALEEGELVGNELVCGVDDSPAAAAAVRAARALGSQLGLRLHLVHAYAPVTPYVVAPGAVAPIPAQELERTARDTAGKVLDRAERLGGEVLTRLRRGRPGHCLNGYAELLDAPLIVLGAPRRGPLASVLLGSAAWELAMIATRPIMVVPDEAVRRSVGQRFAAGYSGSLRPGLRLRGAAGGHARPGWERERRRSR